MSPVELMAACNRPTRDDWQVTDWKPLPEQRQHTSQVCVVTVIPAVTGVVDKSGKGSLLVPFIQTKNKGVLSLCQFLA